MASEEEVVRFIFNGANEMAELMYQLIKWALERREKGRDDGRRDPSKISGRIAPEDAASFASFYVLRVDGHFFWFWGLAGRCGERVCFGADGLRTF